MLWAKKKGARTPQPQEPNDPKTPSNWIQATNPFLRGQLKSSQTYPVQCSLPIRLPLLLLLFYPPTLPTENYITDSVITHKTHPFENGHVYTKSQRSWQLRRLSFSLSQNLTLNTTNNPNTLLQQQTPSLSIAFLSFFEVPGSL